MNYTLRQIADAVCAARGNDSPKEQKRIQERTRMLRDLGFVRSSNPSSQGKTTTFTEADAAAATIAINANLNGNSKGIVASIIDDLHIRPASDPRKRPSQFAPYLEDIKSSKDVFVRVDILMPFGVEAKIGGFELTQLNSDKAFPIQNYASQVIVFPATNLVRPVLGWLSQQSEGS